MPPSRLFHAIVVVGCSMAPLAGCGSAEESPCVETDAGTSDGGAQDGGVSPDAGTVVTDAHGRCNHVGQGWPTTK